MKRAYNGSNRGLKRRKGGWFFRIDGSVSIFLIMVLAFVFLFDAVLIDYARIAAANTQGERLARAGIRSVLSAYDVELREKYGLFASGGTDGNMLLSSVLNDNLHESGRSDAFNLIQMGVESSTVEWSRPLGEYGTFRRQINEEMKYKAPIDFTLELGGKFKPLSGAMAEASQVTKVLRALQPLYDEREEALDLMIERRKQAAESGRALLQLIMNPPGDSLQPSTLGEVSTAADIAAQYDDFVYKYTWDMNRDSREPARYTYPLSRYSQQSALVIQRIPPAMNAFREQHNVFIEQAESALLRARELNDEMKVVLEQSRNSGSSKSDRAKDWDIPGSSGNEIDSDPLHKLREQEDSLILDQADFTGIEEHFSTQKRGFERLEPVTAALPGVLAEFSGLYSNGSRMIGSVLAAAQSVGNYLGSYGAGGSLIEAELAALEEHRSSDKQRKQWEKEAKTKLSDAMKTIDIIRELNDRAGEAMQRYDTLQKYYEEILSLNKGLDDARKDGQTSSDPYAAGSSAMTNMDGVYDVMTSALTGTRDRLFQTEYSALYFQHFDLSALSSMGSGMEGANVDKLAAQMDPHAQELEYILYGFHNPAGNIAAAYGEIFAMRLAIRTMEGFVKKAGIGNPLAVLAAALLYGIEQAVQDMLKLCKDGSIPLSEFIPAQLTYRDYLRLFLMIHGSGESQLSRMLAVIRLNTGINPAERNTYASANIRFGLRLWFLPGMITLLNYSGVLAGDVKGKIYYRGIQADSAY
ncbi:hypothetical protein [Paenibacillus sp. GCM10012306]|uniref:hypothetical protein n=1 Tax=Paenibacillus sp. GCM10012306 TaxID=3317342 RepID=UPI0036220ECB